MEVCQSCIIGCYKLNVLCEIKSNFTSKQRVDFYWANEGISGPFIMEDAHSILRQKLLI